MKNETYSVNKGVKNIFSHFLKSVLSVCCFICKDVIGGRGGENGFASELLHLHLKKDH